MRGIILWSGRGVVGEESEEGANDKMMGMDPDQLTFCIVATYAGIGCFSLHSFIMLVKFTLK